VPAIEETLLDRHAEEFTAPVVPTVPLVPDIQGQVESTPTLSQKPFATQAGTPISTLLTSIQQGFLFTPCSPLSPPQTYLPLATNDDSEIYSPTPTFSRPVEAKTPQTQEDYLTLAARAGGIIDQEVLELTSTQEEAKAQDGGSETERQVLSDVEVNQ
jgi:hypothetical protein